MLRHEEEEGEFCINMANKVCSWLSKESETQHLPGIVHNIGPSSRICTGIDTIRERKLKTDRLGYIQVEAIGQATKKSAGHFFFLIELVVLVQCSSFFFKCRERNINCEIVESTAPVCPRCNWPPATHSAWTLESL